MRVGHQRDQVAHMRVGVDVVQADPCPEFAQIACQIEDVGSGLAVAPRVRAYLRSSAVGGGVLGNDQQFFDASLDQLFRLAQDGVGGAGGQFAAHVWDDAELALVVTALGDFQVAVVARGERDACGWAAGR